MAESHGGRKLIILWQQRNRERKSDGGQDKPFKGTSLVTYFLQLSLIS
jgi:hypothetical protein